MASESHSKSGERGERAGTEARGARIHACDLRLGTPGLLCLAAVFGVVVATVVVGHPPVAMRSFTLSETIDFLMPLALVALILERGMEVVITMWRGGERTELEWEWAHATGDAKDEARERFERYRCRTQRFAFLLGGFAGVVISSLGIRAISYLLDPASSAELAGWQQSGLVGLDVLVTGGLIGGGSDGIHKIINFFSGYMDQSAAKRKLSPAQ